MVRTIRVVTFPSEDRRFRADVEGAADQLEVALNDGGNMTSGMLDLMQRLLPDYPHIQIRQQNGLATYESNATTWYVYRDSGGGARENESL